MNNKQLKGRGDWFKTGIEGGKYKKKMCRFCGFSAATRQKKIEFTSSTIKRKNQGTPVSNR